jgi:hypothetical protein
VTDILELASLYVFGLMPINLSLPILRGGDTLEIKEKAPALRFKHPLITQLFSFLHSSSVKISVKKHP